MSVSEQNRQWTPEDDNLFRTLVDANTDPEDITAKLNRPL